MLYAALVFWLLIVVLTASGVYRLWCGMVKPRLVHVVLLPGTLAAQLGHVVGLLVTGGTVTNTTLFKNDESGEPTMTRDPKPRIPVVGPVVVGLLPIVFCSVAIWFSAAYLGTGIMDQLSAGEIAVARKLPTSAGDFWQLQRDLITLTERTVNVAGASDWRQWQTGVFAYLLICLVVRMAPFPGSMRGSLAAILILGALTWGASQMWPTTDTQVDRVWPVLSLSVGTLMFVLMASLAVRGIVELAKVLARKS